MLGMIGSLVLAAVIGYLYGSIPTGYWMGKILRGKNFDIRHYGSHKIGVTNVLRILGRTPAFIVACVDISKGIAPILLATYIPQLNGNNWGPSVAGIMAIVGQGYPLYIGFRGGRGAATALGGALILSPLSSLISGFVAAGAIRLSRYVVLGSVVGCVTGMLCGVIFYSVGQVNPAFFARVSLEQLIFLLVGPLIVLFFHRDCIARLLAGTEARMGLKEIMAESSQENR